MYKFIMNKNITDIQRNLNDDERPVFTIGVVADMIGMSVHTLRMHESSGLILPHRTESQHRLYSRTDVERLNYIRYLMEVIGLNIAGIKSQLSLIPCWNIKQCTSEDRANCDAFKSVTEPCWIVKNKGNICKEEDCRLCPIYGNLEPFSNLKSFLKKTVYEVSE